MKKVYKLIGIRRAHEFKFLKDDRLGMIGFMDEESVEESKSFEAIATPDGYISHADIEFEEGTTISDYCGTVTVKTPELVYVFVDTNSKTAIREDCAFFENPECCKALNEMACKKEACRYYKKAHEVSFDRIEKELKVYAGRVKPENISC